MPFFMHIPKTAGTSLATYFPLQNKAKTYVIDSKAVTGKATIEQIAMGVPSDTNIVIGHFSYGLHHLFPGNHETAAVLRHPVTRVQSEFSYIKKVLSQRARHVNAQYAKGSLSDYVKSCSTAQNLMTKMFAGKGLMDQSPVTLDDYQKALHNLLHTDYLGLTEAVDAFVAKFAKKYNLSGKVPIRNTSSQHKNTLSHQEIKLIEEHNKWDMYLYMVAKSLETGTWKWEDANVQI